ncbi:glycosyl hydrolase [Paramagnetospirillum kuznetsovii]|uniref:Glycosyl hydrolase n=1 Tax=Paramagnetospirillum kuznetsovii TaxID=2053833 RepID=A0A364NZA3_9PROT|nr:sialidase family protein [Paramagnetospirillum kuznetsovii]RAU22396.1 glycosyl hydrolase [Paramagnetospirillum kuznetsovii]
MIRLAILLAAGLLAAPAPASAHDGHEAKPAAQPKCAEVSLRCAKSATPAFGADGRMWIIWSAAGRVYVSASADKGASFAAPVAVSDPAEAMDDNGEARPKLLATRSGALVAIYAQRMDNRYNGKVFFTRSTDGGHSFAKPQPMLDGIGQRFETLVQAPSGRITAAWLDTRNRIAAKAAGQDYNDTGVALAWSDDDGASFTGKAIKADYACDCCRLAMALDRDGTPLLAWRHVFGRNLRDHVVAKVKDDAPLAPKRVSEDDWAIDACPRHGPSLGVGADGAWNIVWFTGGKRRQGLFFARSDDEGASFSEPQGFGAANRLASHPQVLARDGRVWRAWKEFDGTTTAIQTQSSADQGKTWDAPRQAAATNDASDHPLLVSDGTVTYLSWLTRDEGYRLVALP